MVIRIGNAASPRWYDLSLSRLEEYIECLAAWGATSAELVLHAGDADEQTARVHVLEDDWFPVFERFRAREIVCHAHAPLHPRFNPERWRNDPGGLQVDWAPVLDAVAEFSQRQGQPAVLVLHGAAGESASSREATASFLAWADAELERRASETALAIELRRPRHSGDAAFDRSRASLTSFLEWLGIERVGACWDLAHDWEARHVVEEWTAEPEADFLRLVNHVHLHDAGDDGSVHHPLRSGKIDWQAPLAALIQSGYDGAITLEVRYRHARSIGDPWTVLSNNYAQVQSFLRALESRAGHDAVIEAMA